MTRLLSCGKSALLKVVSGNVQVSLHKRHNWGHSLEFVVRCEISLCTLIYNFDKRVKYIQPQDYVLYMEKDNFFLKKVV